MTKTPSEYSEYRGALPDWNFYQTCAAAHL